jgi:hypothetical protein
MVPYGQNRAALDQQLQVGSGDMRYEFAGLASGTWYFSVQIVDTNGLTSAPSSVVEYAVP